MDGWTHIYTHTERANNRNCPQHNNPPHQPPPKPPPQTPQPPPSASVFFPPYSFLPYLERIPQRHLADGDHVLRLVQLRLPQALLLRDAVLPRRAPPLPLARHLFWFWVGGCVGGGKGRGIRRVSIRTWMDVAPINPSPNQSNPRYNPTPTTQPTNQTKPHLLDLLVRDALGARARLPVVPRVHRPRRVLARAGQRRRARRLRLRRDGEGREAAVCVGGLWWRGDGVRHTYGCRIIDAK